jgi:hypothetical protein
MIHADESLDPRGLLPLIDRFWDLSGIKIRRIEAEYDASQGSPVYTERGEYTTRGWTEWTQGFQVGAALLQFDACGDGDFLELGRRQTIDRMPVHVTHFGVHDHGFNNVSTFGNLLRLMNEGRIVESEWERRYYELALMCSGAVQARRWSRTADGGGFIYSFNGPHSLFADTIRSLRALAVAHKLGHRVLGENDAEISLLERLVQHSRTTAEYAVYYGEGRDAYDIRGRVAHESLFNMNDGRYRCPNSQQGYSPFSTWTRGLSWIMLGYAELLEFIDQLDDADLATVGGRADIEAMMTRAAAATCDFYLEYSSADGIPYWDTGAPGLANLDQPFDSPSDPFNPEEPVDSSAAAIAGQALLRFGRRLRQQGDCRGDEYWQAGLTVVKTLLDEPYISSDPEHHGLILHSVYHRPNGWDAVPAGQQIPCGESSMWGDYHARELALYVQRIAQNKPYLTFWGARP